MQRREFVKKAGGLVACGAMGVRERVSAQLVQPATGPLKVHPKNPRYFTDGSGRAIFLTGSHTWTNLQDNGIPPIPTFDWPGYIAMMKSHNHNFMRLWGWQQSAWAPWTPDKIVYEPTLYVRTGPGMALDGGLKFDLKTFGSHELAGLLSRRDFFDRGNVRTEAWSNNPAQPDATSKVRQGVIEKSNVNSVAEMSKMIELTRAYTQISAMLQQQGDLRKSALDKLADVPA